MKDDGTTAGAFWTDVPDDVALERYRTLVNTVDDGIYQLDAEGRFVAVNDIIVELTGYPREELIGEFVSMVLTDEDINRIGQEILHRLNTGEAKQENFEFTAHTADGEASPCELRISLLVEDGNFQGTVGIVRDITERKRADQLEESNELLREFAYAVSHDLREPLRMVSSYLNLLEQRYGDELDEDGREFISYAVDGADRMREMIDGLLEYARVDNQGEPFEMVDLNAVVADVFLDLQIKIEEAGAEIEVGDLPRVYGDGNQLNQVFQNLLSNAIEYSGDGPPRVHVSAERDGEEWIVSVRDEGVGMDPDDVDRVFQVFQRLHTQEESAGTGIGLALVKRIVERHGGEIWVEAEPGGGSTFYFTLPTVDTDCEPT